MKYIKNKITDTAKFILLAGTTLIVIYFAYTEMRNIMTLSEQSAAIINIAGRQRMYSQRIASFAAQYALGSESSRTDLIIATTKFESNTSELNDKLHHLGHSYANESIGIIDIAALNIHISNYLKTARKISDLPQSNPQLKTVLSSLFQQAKEPLLVELDNLVLSEQRFAEKQLNKIAKIQAVLFGFILAMLLAGAFLIVRPLEQNAKRLRTLSEIDSLTGAFSRRMFLERANDELRYAKRNAKPLSILMIDVDYFKKVNDIFGHAAGDIALTTLVSHFTKLLHRSDFIGRLGGEEFAVILPETSVENAIIVAERMRTSVENLVLPYGNRYINLSISVGVASLSDEVKNISELLKSADIALYDAKAEGRNKVNTNKLNLIG